MCRKIRKHTNDFTEKVILKYFNQYSFTVNICDKMLVYGNLLDFYLEIKLNNNESNKRQTQSYLVNF